MKYIPKEYYQMSVGGKIRAIRILRNMTQKELGLKVGFSVSTADVRIRQYENNKMKPKAQKLKEIADALNVDVSALKAHDIYSDLDLMQVLFELEEQWGLELHRKKGMYIFRFNENHENALNVMQNLNSWYVAKSKILNWEKFNSLYNVNHQDSLDIYKLWKRSFPLDKDKLESIE